MHKLRILILYPDSAGLALLTSMLKSLGHIIEEATTDRAAVRSMERNEIDLVLAGVDPLDADALELLMYVRRKHREVPVILLFPRLHPERAKEALRLGAMAVLKYPVPAAELRAAVLQALERSETRHVEATGPASPSASALASAATLPKLAAVPAAASESPAVAARPAVAGPLISRPAAPLPLPASVASAAIVPPHRVEQHVREIGLVGNDPSWRQVIDLAVTIAGTRSSVLIKGEPGTGKSLVAQLIHSLGLAPERPFVTVEGSAMADEHSMQQPDDLSPAAGTNHSLDWSSKMAAASGGTLYLHEVAALPMELQLHLLRELQFRDYEASSGHASQNSEPRLIMSTSENLTSHDRPGAIPAGVVSPHQRDQPHAAAAPAPRDRRGAAGRVVSQPLCPGVSQVGGRLYPRCARGAAEARLARQRSRASGRDPACRRAVQRPANHVKSPGSDPQPQPSARAGGGGMPRPHLKMGVRPLKEALEEPEKRIIIEALHAFNWNRQETARVLDINRTTLYKKMKKYNLIDETVWVN